MHIIINCQGEKSGSLSQRNREEEEQVCCASYTWGKVFFSFGFDDGDHDSPLILTSSTRIVSAGIFKSTEARQHASSWWWFLVRSNYVDIIRWIESIKTVIVNWFLWPREGLRSLSNEEKGLLWSLSFFFANRKSISDNGGLCIYPSRSS